MDDMMDMLGGDAILGRRLMAYADTRLSPDLATSSRLRARVLAVAHRRADLARGDAGLMLLSRPEVSASMASLPLNWAAQARHRASGRGRVGRRQRALAALLAATLGVAVLAGGVFAARPGGPLYDARLWAETLTLPSDPSGRALAELARLEARLREASEASRSGDTASLTAALAAYQSIMTEASAAAILSDDDVASAVVATGVGRNIQVLQALLDRVPSQASDAISRALDSAITRSNAAVDRIGASRTNNGGNGAGPSQPAGGPASRPTGEPRARPTSKATAQPTAKPTARPSAKPTEVPASTATPAPKNGGPWPKPTKSPPGQGHGTGPDH
jgi:hypothetical protein